MTTVLDNTRNFALGLSACTLALYGHTGAAILATAAAIGIAVLRYPSASDHGLRAHMRNN
jgi:hypothetical protein